MSPHGFTASPRPPTSSTRLDPTPSYSSSVFWTFPPSYGGIGLQSLERSADEEILGSFTGIAASPIAFCHKTELLVYFAIAEALQEMRDATGLLNVDAEGMKLDSPELLPSNRELGKVAARTLVDSPTDDQLTLAT